MKVSDKIWLLFVVLCGMSSVCRADDARWWPVQKVPKGLVRSREHGDPAIKMLVQSVAGLAAKSVNHGHGDELVWVYNDNKDMERWYQEFLKAHPAVEERGTATAWELVGRFKRRGTIKGYILYSTDRSDGATSDHREGMDQSVNIATSLAGLLDGVLVSEEIEAEATAAGLTRLMDVRDKSLAWCFETYKDKFNRNLLCAQDPRISNTRDLAIAQNAFTLFGADEPIVAALEWLEPLSPILGWNGGDEFKTTKLTSIYGHFQTATDWCMNLPVLMAGSENRQPAVKKTFDHQNINWNDHRSTVSFAMTDGDNVQWLQSNFFHGNNSYWNNPHRGKIPFGWSCCFAHLAQLCPVTMEYAWHTQTRNDQFIEWGGGYYYPDLFGDARPEASQLLARQVQRTWKYMRQTGTHILAFNVARAESAKAMKAYATIAEQTDGLSAILVFQYAPYEAGAGKTFWVKDQRGIEIPVITARYSIWENSNARPRSGTPAKVAREIKESTAGKSTRDDWVIVHAWSYFRHEAGDDEDAENIPQDIAVKHGASRGYDAALWCADRLPANVHVVSPEEMVWRIRMKHDPATTKKLLAERGLH
ncbi:hypothetical protein [Schlesneria sp. DSM 10557]|uniref:hypothetical protein n=1 Tax=Schlesneria sp. DSM 10557 TaxID=3044399 RepID=UPI00359FFFA3